jgi:hypothetical protein
MILTLNFVSDIFTQWDAAGVGSSPSSSAPADIVHFKNDVMESNIVVLSYCSKIH